MMERQNSSKCCGEIVRHMRIHNDEIHLRLFPRRIQTTKKEYLKKRFDQKDAKLNNSIMEDHLGYIAEGFEGQQLYRVPYQVLQRIREKPFTRDFVVTDLGFFPPSLGHGVRRKEGLEQWVFIFVHSGSGWFEIEEDRQQVSENQIILIPPCAAHRYGASTDNPWSIFWFHFEGKGAEDLLKWTGNIEKGVAMDAPSPESIRRHFRSILNVVERGYHEHALLELSRALINVLTLLHRNPLRKHRNAAFERIEAVMDKMRSELDHPETLSGYARFCSLSVPQFSHLFKLHTGISPMTYLTELRIQRACEYLDTSNLNIKQIASEVGFEDPLYFSRVFKKCTGKSPKQYREQDFLSA